MIKEFSSMTPQVSFPLLDKVAYEQTTLEMSFINTILMTLCAVISLWDETTLNTIYSVYN